MILEFKGVPILVEYLVLGVGVFLVLISLIYTYIVDRRVKKSYTLQKRDIQDRITKEEFREYPVYDRRASFQVGNLSQVKESITNMDDELTELVGELRSKEDEIRQIVNRVKGWKNEVAEPPFQKLMASSSENELLLKEEVPRTKEVVLDKPVLDEPALNLDSFSKYDRILRLAEQGFAIEEIARQLNLGYREVELVVKLRRKGASEGA